MEQVTVVTDVIKDIIRLKKYIISKMENERAKKRK